MLSTTFIGMSLLVGCCCPCGKGNGPAHYAQPAYYGQPTYYGAPGYYVPADHFPQFHYRVSPYNPVYHPPTVLPHSPKLLPDKAKDKTLYERLGGEAAIKAVIDDFVARAAANPKVNFTRKGTTAEWKPTPAGIDHLKKMLVDLVGSVTGGPQKYTGRNMKDVHKGMKITQAEFDALASDLKATLDKFKVPAKEQDELLKIVASTAPDIVEKQKN
jgi:hemoglobin